MVALNVAALGICECGTLLNIEGMPADSANADWPCPHCKKNTTGAHFGYEEVTPGDWQRTRWVSVKKGKLVWVNKEPIESVTFGNHTIFPNN